MAFPTIPTAGNGRLLSNTQADTSQTRTFPSLSSLTKVSGDLLLAIIVAYQASVAGSTFGSWGGSFTEFRDAGGTSGMALGCAYKWSDGTETGTFTVTQATVVTGHVAMFLLSIAGAHASTPPETGTWTAATATAADSPSFDPAGWAAEDTLWIGVGGNGETATGGAFGGVTAAPANYGDYAESGISADAVGGVEGAVAFRQLNASSEDIGTWSVDTSNARNGSVAIAVRPAPEAFIPRHTGAHWQDPAVFMRGLRRAWHRRPSGIFVPDLWLPGDVRA
jgi:hypothetical protein